MKLSKFRGLGASGWRGLFPFPGSSAATGCSWLLFVDCNSQRCLIKSNRGHSSRVLLFPFVDVVLRCSAGVLRSRRLEGCRHRLIWLNKWLSLDVDSWGSGL